MKANFASAMEFKSYWKGAVGIHANVCRELRRNDLPKLRYLSRAALISFVPVMAVIISAASVGRLSWNALTRIPNWRLPNPGLNLTMGYLDVLIFTPLVETGLIVFFLKLFRKLRVPEKLLPLFCSLGWGSIHVHYHGSLWGMTAAWPFFCFTIIILAREKSSLDKAWLEASTVHGLANLLGLTVGICANWIHAV